MYLSLYRKWRPQTFDEVVGQEHVVRTLRNALDAKRAAHAYIFAGPRGTGKTTLARLLAKGLNCQHGPTGSPCNRCGNCTRIARGISVDVIEIDGASNRGIDEIRDIREMVKFAPAEGQYKVYIIDEVHMLTTEAFNALLKVLEEPPGHVVFVFATTEPHKIPATIVSRCQKFDFRAFTVDEIAAQLERVAREEGVSIDPDARALIALHSEGGMRDALGYLDQCIAFASGTIDEAAVAQVLGVVEAHRLEELADALAKGDLGRCLLLVKAAADQGRDLRQLTADAVRYFRDLLVLAAAPGSDELVAMTREWRERARDVAKRFSVQRLLEIVEGLGKAEAEARWAPTAQLPLEMALIQLIRGGDRVDVNELARRVDALERRLAGLADGPADARAAAGPARESPAADARPAPGRMWEGAPSAPARTAGTAGGAARGGPAHGMPGASEPAASLGPANREGSTLERSERIEPAPADPELGRRPSSAQETPESMTAVGGASTPDEQALLEAVRAAWTAILETLRMSKNAQQEAFLREGRPVAVQGDTVIVGFSPSHRFHQANMEKERNRSIVEKAMSKVLGRSVRMQAVLGASADVRSVPPGVPGSGGQGPAAGAGPSPRAGEGPVPGSKPAPDASRGLPDGPANKADGTMGGSPQQAQGRQPVPDQARPGGSGVVVHPDEIDEPIVKAALKLFGGTIIRIEREEAEQS